MVIDTFLDKTWLSFVRAEIIKHKGKLSRNGYNNRPTIRDSFDPRKAETIYITDIYNILCRVWDKFLWSSTIHTSMKNSEDSAMLHATYTRFGKTLLSAYGNQDGYGFHTDIDLNCVVTAVLMLTLDEQKFTGGNLILEDKEIEFQNNRLIIFPSCRMHSVTPIQLEQDEFDNRRFTLQYFISSSPPERKFPDESSTK